MNQDAHEHDSQPGSKTGVPGMSLNRLAFSATLHCLSGCAVGEVLGMVIGNAVGLSNGTTIGISVLLAFFFGYLFTMVPLIRSGLSLSKSVQLALAADTASIAIMEVVDNLVMVVVPGAMTAPLDALLFWGSLAGSLVLAGLAAYPVNRWLIGRGSGHAVAHRHHG